ncbi:hypothetical protein [Streptomyces globosus]|uniref:hypothetical protein n=1 Tax=Streptomyces globosus TaxID=68209 RepID=UPI0038068607
MHDPSLPFSDAEPPFNGDSTAGPSGPVADERFGPVDVLLDAGRGTVVVAGGALPEVRLVRADGAKPNRYAPIGTRDGARLTLTVDGGPASIRPARAWIPRRSYRVDVRADAGRYRLVPCSAAASRFLRDGRRLGEFTSRGDGSVAADWLPGADPQPQDAAVGYALAAAFGTGGRSLGDLLVDVVDALLPG